MSDETTVCSFTSIAILVYKVITRPDKPGTYAKRQSAMPLADQAVRTAMAHARKADWVPGRNWGVLEVPACYVSMLERPPQ